MKKRVLLLIMCVFAITAASAQITSVAVVGAGVGGWPTGAAGEVDVNQMTSTDGENWVINDLVVTGPGIKFRANNNWDSTEGLGLNVGAPAAGVQWPSAIGVNAGSSSDIKVGVIPGTYTVKLNSTTMAYSFEGGAIIPVVKLVGTAVDLGSVQMIGVDAENFSLTATLLEGTAKFEIDGVEFSDGAFPAGLAFEGGSAVGPIPAGEYLIKFNVSTLEYSFEVPPFDIVGITGAAGPGWGSDYEFTTTDGINYSLMGAVFVEGGMLFRLNNSYDVKFGGSVDATDIFAAPMMGMLAMGGSDLVVSAMTAGTYDITFNLQTLEYTVTGALSTKGFSSANFKAYPNPTNNVWNFTSTKEKIETIKIVDVLGKTVLSVSPKSNVTNVDASALNTGIYFAKIATAKATETIKLMKN